jgi:dihydroxyacid dehydratase/phosphogluconate dehydratase
MRKKVEVIKKVGPNGEEYEVEVHHFIGGKYQVPRETAREKKKSKSVFRKIIKKFF